MMADLQQFDAIDRLYSCSGVKPTFHDVDDQRYRDLFRLINTFRRELGDAAQEPVWENILRPLKRYLFYLGAAPLPFNFIRLTGWQERLDTDLALVQRINPRLTALAALASTQIESLSNNNENPLLTSVAQVVYGLPPRSRSALVVKESRLSQLSEMVINESHIPKTKTVTPRALAGMETYDCIIAIGACRWFPGHIFDSPRASQLHVVRYRGLNDRPQVGPAFVASSQQSLQAEIPKEKISYEAIEIIDSYSSVDWRRVAANLRHRAIQEDDQEEVDGRLVVLDGGLGVFVDPESQMLVVDPTPAEDGQSDGCLRRVSADQIQPGMALLLRTAGGGDLIVPTANRILGPKAAEYRAKQQLWKSRLRLAVKSRGMQNICNRLLALGSSKAAPSNVRVWMSERSIKPQDFEDFRAIIKLISIDEDVARLWQSAAEIDSAHRRAGFLIRQRLLQQVKGASLDALQKVGKVEFVLPEEEGGSLTAFLVEGVGTEVYQVPVSQIGRLIEEDEETYGTHDPAQS